MIVKGANFHPKNHNSYGIFTKIINIVLLSNIRKVTTEAGVASIKGAHDARLEYGEPVEEGGGDE